MSKKSYPEMQLCYIRMYLTRKAVIVLVQIVLVMNEVGAMKYREIFIYRGEMDIFTYNSEGIKILLILGSIHKYIFSVLKNHALFQWHTAMNKLFGISCDERRHLLTVHLFGPLFLLVRNPGCGVTTRNLKQLHLSILKMPHSTSELSLVYILGQQQLQGIRVFPQLHKVGRSGIFVLFRSEEQNEFSKKFTFNRD